MYGCIYVCMCAGFSSFVCNCFFLLIGMFLSFACGPVTFVGDICHLCCCYCYYNPVIFLIPLCPLRPYRSPKAAPCLLKPSVVTLATKLLPDPGGATSLTPLLHLTLIPSSPFNTSPPPLPLILSSLTKIVCRCCCCCCYYYFQIHVQHQHQQQYQL